MTGRGIHYRDKSGDPVEIVFAADDAATWLGDFSKKVTLTELDLPETLAALDQAKKKGVQGPRIYDYAHALVADKAGAQVLLTRDKNDFTGLTRAKILWP